MRAFSGPLPVCVCWQTEGAKSTNGKADNPKKLQHRAFFLFVLEEEEAVDEEDVWLVSGSSSQKKNMFCMNLYLSTEPENELRPQKSYLIFFYSCTSKVDNQSSIALFHFK